MTRKKKAPTTDAKEAASAAATECALPPSVQAPRRAAHAMPPATSEPAPMSFKEMQRLHAMRMELFGFGGWLASTLFYVLFLAWAYVPEATLEAYGFTYLPSKHWAVAVPAMIVVTYLFSLVLYKAVNLMSTPPLNSYATITDSHAVPLPEGCASFADDTAATPSIGDISIFEVNRHLFSSSRARQQPRTSSDR